jgi:hypothetical protein
MFKQQAETSRQQTKKNKPQAAEPRSGGTSSAKAPECEKDQY